MAIRSLAGNPPAWQLLKLVPVAVLLLLPALNRAAEHTDIEIGPGPQKITPEEQVLAPDPAAGSQHGIILLDETNRDDSPGSDSLISHHVRAKIFTNEGRGLADVEIPFSTGAQLKKWWGWTILPDGTVREMKKEEFQEQESARAGGYKMSVLRGALPAVAPGCVIDYGYQLWQKGIYHSLRVELQQGWPTRSLSYRWVPWGGSAASFRVARAAGLAVSVTHDSRSVLVTGSRLPAVVDEPWMPPRKEVTASTTFYYRKTSESAEVFWNLEAKREAHRVQDFIKEKPIRDALAAMSFPAGADLFAKLRVVYAWMTANVRHMEFRSSEEAEAQSGDDDSPRTAKEVLAEKKADGRQMEYLFIGFARALGAEADMVLTTDRTDHFFDAALLTTEQFDWSLVSVRAPGEGEDKAIFVEIGSGVPFGELPWWITGASGMLASSKGAHTVMLPPSDPGKNQSDTQVSISFESSDQTAAIHWSRIDTGQPGLMDRLELRSMAPEERSKRLQEMCGARGEFEVTKAEAPKLQDLSAGLHLQCEGTMMNTNLTEALTRYSFSLDGFWNEEVPEFTEEHRERAMVFPFPRIDRTVLDVRTPVGFTNVTPPTVAPLESPYGRYALFITATPEGYHVERMFALTAIAVPAQEYAPLRRFLADIRQADRTALEFRKP